MSKPNKVQIRSSTAEYPQNIFATGELDEKVVCRDFRHTAECRGQAMTTETPVQQPAGYDDMLRDMKAIAGDLRGIQERGVAQYTPVVEQIISTRNRDAHHIQLTLDYLLDFACHPAGLALYKKLCRYYYTLDPAATADYVNYYRKMWDSEETEDQK